MQEVRGWSDLTQMERCYMNQDMFSFVPGAYDKYQALIQEDRRRSQQVKSEKFKMADDVLICEQVDYIEVVYQIEFKREDVSDEVLFRNEIVPKKEDQVIRSCEIYQGEKQKQTCVFCEYHCNMDRHVVDLKDNLYSFEYCDSDCVPRLIRHAIRYKSVVAMDVKKVISDRYGDIVEEPIQVTLISYDGQIVYSTYIMPKYKVIDYKEKVTGIIDLSKHDFRLFDDVKIEVDRVIRDFIVVGHGISSDLNLFGLKKSYFDTLSLVDGRRISLQLMMAYVFGVAIQNGKFSSLEDAMSVMLLYRALVGKRINYKVVACYKRQKHVLRLFSPLLFDLMLQGVLLVGDMCCSRCLLYNRRIQKEVEEFGDGDNEKVYGHMSECERFFRDRKREDKLYLRSIITRCFRVECVQKEIFQKVKVDNLVYLDCQLYSLVILSDVAERVNRAKTDLQKLYVVRHAIIGDLRLFLEKRENSVAFFRGIVVKQKGKTARYKLRGVVGYEWTSVLLFASRHSINLKVFSRSIEVCDSMIKVMLFEVWLHTFFDHSRIVRCG